MPQQQINTVSAEWVKWVAGALLALNSVCVGYVVRGENRLTTLENTQAAQATTFAQHVADSKETKTDIYGRLAAVDQKQLEVLQSIGVVREDVAAIRGALGIKRHNADQ